MDRRRRSGPDGPKRSILVLSPTFFPAVWLSGSQTRRCYSQEMTNSGNSHTTGLRPCESRSAAEKNRRNTERKITHRNNTQGTHNDAFTRHEEFVGMSQPSRRQRLQIQSIHGLGRYGEVHPGHFNTESGYKIRLMAQPRDVFSARNLVRGTSFSADRTSAINSQAFCRIRFRRC